MIGPIIAALAGVSTIHAPNHGVQTGFGKPGYNPDKMICVSRDVTGSRLQAVRECHTAQQWQDQKEQEVVGLARQQHNGDSGCNTGQCSGMPKNDTPW
ncbi:MAG TPA: hypothetical protein VGC56_10335 [Allosphingosinicella sp.]|jgi:hypothetical protein